MANFTNHTKSLIEDVINMLKFLEYRPTFHKTIVKNGKTKYTVRIARETQRFLNEIDLVKV